MRSRELDVVLFGATGFVGRLTADHLATAAPPGTRIALAARSMAGLEQLRAQLPERAADWELIEVDAADVEGLRRLAGRTSVLATTAGPYTVRQGSARAAAERAPTTPTHRRTAVVRWSTRTDDGAATGARIVHRGRSIPSSLVRKQAPPRKGP